MVKDFRAIRDVIARAIENGGRSVSRNGPFITARLYFVGPAFPNQLYRELSEFMRDDEQIENSLIPSTDDGIRKIVHILDEHDIIEDVTKREHEEGSLMKNDLVVDGRIPTDFTKEEYLASFSFAELTEQQFTRNYYDLTEEADMDWLEASKQAITNSLLGFQGQREIPEPLDGFQRSERPTAGIPEVILSPYQVAWPQSEA